MIGHFDTFADFLQMGKHGLYVWLSYGLSLIVFLYNILANSFERCQFFKDAKRRLKREKRSV